MLRNVQDKKVEVVIGFLDAVAGTVVDVDDRWLTLRKGKKLVYVQIDKIRHLSVADS